MTDDDLFRIEMQVTKTWAFETVGQVIGRELAGLEPGEFEIAVNGVEFGVRYEQEQAVGDSGRPVPGDHVGDYTVTCPSGRRIYQHVSPHGTSGYGTTGARAYAARQLGVKIAKIVHASSPAGVM